MRINHNISALRANNQLFKTNNALDKSLEKLSSGYRINRAADDAAGMAISRRMKTQIAGLEQASRNAADGISVIQTAEGALNEVNAILQRMRELAVQAANGTYTLDDRKSIQKEIDQLQAEIKRISTDTEFNTKTLLDGSIDNMSYSDNKYVKLVSLTDGVKSGVYTLKIDEDAAKAVARGKRVIKDSTAKVGHSGIININGNEIEIDENDTFAEVYEKIRETCENANVKAILTNETTDPAADKVRDNPDTAGYTTVNITEASDSNKLGLVFISNEYGSDQTINIYCDNDDLKKALGLEDINSEVKGKDAKVTFGGGFSKTATLTTDGNYIKITDNDDFELIFDAQPGAKGTANITVLDAGTMKLQIGANEHQTMEVRFPSIDPVALGIDSVNLCTEEGAQNAIAILDAANNKITAFRSKLGAYQNRLEHSISNLDTTSENMTEALSRIEDTDMAKEMATYTQKNVLAQAGTAMLAQANQRPQTILTLLQG